MSGSEKESEQSSNRAPTNHRLAILSIAIQVPFWDWYFYTTGTPLKMIVVAVVATVVLGTTATVVFNGIEHRTKREQRQQRFDASRGNRLATICIALAVP